MELLIGLLLSFIILLFGVFKGIFIGYSISLSLIIFVIIAFKIGYTTEDIIHSAWKGGKRSVVVLKIFLLIGLVTASWLSSGTIPATVYYAMKVMDPRFFVVFAFLATSLVSYILGSSLGTASTIGVVLIIMARSGDINLNLVGGTILAACYVGDRASPMSSSASLVSNLTDTEFYPMLKRFRKTTIIPLIVSILIYFLLSLNNPLDTSGNTILQDIDEYFVINFWVLLPALIMLTLSILQINVRIAMIVSIIIGSFIAVSIQNVEVLDLFKTLFYGYKLEPSNPLVTILKGGGVLSMMKPGYVIFVSCAMAGVLEKIGLFDKSYNLFRKVDTRAKLYLATAVASLVCAAYGGNQSIAVVMTSQMMKKVYEKLDIDNYELATDISNTTILLSAVIPWNIANFVIANTLEVSPVKIVPFAFYLYIPIIYNYILFKKSVSNA
ncbi:MAG: Na+/H+ antiporter NhaC family protein [Tissierellaceae bacterium]|nr:Na+/H+ antiporter NhaC family protein [Tissierellaceae bacterium]